jgi:hypothetical protein
VEVSGKHVALDDGVTTVSAWRNLRLLRGGEEKVGDRWRWTVDIKA